MLLPPSEKLVIGNYVIPEWPATRHCFGNQEVREGQDFDASRDLACRKVVIERLTRKKTFS